MRIGDLLLVAVSIAVASAVFAGLAVRAFAYYRHRSYGIREPLPFTRGLQRALDAIDTSTSAFALAAGGLVLLAALAALVQSDFGSQATNRGIGWAHDLSLVEAIHAGDDRAAMAASLGELSFAPSWSHRAAAAAATTFGAPPPAAFQVMTAVLVVVGCALMALRLALLAAPSPAARVAAGAAAAAALLAVNRFSLGFSDYGDFYPQLFGTVAALAAFLFVAMRRQRTRLAAAVVLAGAVILPYVDGIPAAWFAVAGGIVVVANFTPSFPGPLGRRAPFAAALAVILTAILAGHPAFRSYLDIAGNNGGFQFEVPFTSISTNLSRNPPALLAILAVAIAIVAAAIVAAHRGLPRPSWALLTVHAGFVAIAAVFLAAFLARAAGGQWSYFLAGKMLFILALETAASVAASAAAVAAERFPAVRRRWQAGPSLAALGLAAVLFLCQLPFLTYTHSQDYLIDLRAGLAAHAGDPSLGDASTRPYPQFKVSPFENYYLAIGVLRIPRDNRTVDWLFQQQARGAANVPFSWVARTVPEYSGGPIIFRAGGTSSPYLDSGWSQPETFGAWTDGPVAGLVWRWTQKPEGMIVNVTTGANVNDAHPEQKVDVLVNGQKVDTWTFKKGDEIASRRAVVPPAVLEGSDVVDLRFHVLDPVSGLQLGVSGDARLLGLSLRDLTATPLPRYEGRSLSFGARANGQAYLWDGWSAPEERGTWTDGAVSRLVWQNALRTNADSTLTIKVTPYLTDNHPTLDVKVVVNDRDLGVWSFRKDTAEPRTSVRVPAGVLTLSAVTEIRFEFTGAVSPRSLGQSSDARELGFFLEELSLVPN